MTENLNLKKEYSNPINDINNEFRNGNLNDKDKILRRNTAKVFFNNNFNNNKRENSSVNSNNSNNTNNKNSNPKKKISFEEKNGILLEAFRGMLQEASSNM
jgi:hypothetical protein